jgi:4-hydroxy-tetrahydrodipicolinate synthase
VRLSHDERTELRSGTLELDGGRDVQVREPDHCARQLRDDDASAHDHQPLEPLLHLSSLGRIAELAQQVGDCSRIRRPRIPDRQIHASTIWAVLGEVLTAIVTPFRRDGTIDFERFGELAQHLVETGSDGIVVAGTTGESPTLSDDERFELFRVAVETLDGRATVVAGTGTYSTAHSVHLTGVAHELGVDGFLVVTPYYSKPPARGVVEHFRAIADVSDRPIIVYNIPGRVVINLEPETIAALAELPTVRAVKQANDDLVQARRIVGETDLDLYAGDDNLVFPFLELGGVGGVCVHTHVAGPRVKAMVRAFRDGDIETARRFDQELEPAYELLKVQTNPIAIKAALTLLGHDVGGLRLPLVPASESEIARVRDCLERLGALSPAAV